MARTPKSQKKDDDNRARLQAAEQDVFVREVDEALRQDEMSGLLKRYGIPLLLAVVLGLAGFGGFLWWKQSQGAAAEERSEQLVMALDRIEAGNLDTADKQLAPLAERSGDSGVPARLLRAGIALEQNRRADAVKLYAAVAADESVPKPFRDLALVREVAASFDTLPPDQVVARLKPLAAPGSPWFGVAGELVGIAYLKQNKPELAGPLFAKIARDKDTPETLKRRARQMAGLLGVDAIDDIAKPASIDAPEPLEAAEQ